MIKLKEEEFLNVKDIAEIFSVTQATIYNWINDGKLVPDKKNKFTVNYIKEMIKNLT